jgi:hypothetical protein
MPCAGAVSARGPAAPPCTRGGRTQTHLLKKVPRRGRSAPCCLGAGDPRRVRSQRRALVVIRKPVRGSHERLSREGGRKCGSPELCPGGRDTKPSISRSYQRLDSKGMPTRQMSRSGLPPLRPNHAAAPCASRAAPQGQARGRPSRVSLQVCVRLTRTLAAPKPSPTRGCRGTSPLPTWGSDVTLPCSHNGSLRQGTSPKIYSTRGSRGRRAEKPPDATRGPLRGPGVGGGGGGHRPCLARGGGRKPP